MSAMKIWMIRTLLKNTTLIMFVLLFIGFGMLAPKFLNLQNFEIILSNASYAGIIAIGMTFVLLTGGIDLSVGSIMYVSAVVTGLVVNDAGLPVSVGLAAGLLVGLAFGVFNATVITGFGIPPFIATLVTMIAGRGLGLLITKSAAVDFPDEITDLSSLRLGGVLQLNILIFVLVVMAATVFLSFTPSGRRLYAVGNDVDAAHKAGVKTQRIIASTYIVSGALRGACRFRLDFSARPGYRRFWHRE